MTEWFNWFVSCITTAVQWLETVQVFGVPVIAFIVSVFVMGVVLRAALYKA